MGTSQPPVEIKFQCFVCGTPLNVPRPHQGGRGRCPTCEELYRVSGRGLGEDQPNVQARCRFCLEWLEPIVACPKCNRLLPSSCSSEEGQQPGPEQCPSCEVRLSDVAKCQSCGEARVVRPRERDTPGLVDLVRRAAEFAFGLLLAAVIRIPLFGPLGGQAARRRVEEFSIVAALSLTVVSGCAVYWTLRRRRRLLPFAIGAFVGFGFALLISVI